MRNLIAKLAASWCLFTTTVTFGYFMSPNYPDIAAPYPHRWLLFIPLCVGTTWAAVTAGKATSPRRSGMRRVGQHLGVLEPAR